MERFLHYLATFGFSTGLLLIAVVLGAIVLRQWRRGSRRIGLGVLSAACFLAGLGGLLPPGAWLWWTGAGALAVLFAMLAVLILTEHWWAPLGYAVGVIFLLALGGLVGAPTSKALAEGLRVLSSLELEQPGWVRVGPVSIPLAVLPLLLVPVIVFLSRRSMSGLGPVRRWLAIGLRCLEVVFLTLALAGACLVRPNDTIAVIFLVDYSYSIPQEFDPDANPNVHRPEDDRRWARITRFINDSVAHRGREHRHDLAGVIVFGRKPREVTPPGNYRTLDFTRVETDIDRNYTDLGAAIRLALASFPPGTRKRIVLLSDGYENLGSAEQEMRLAEKANVQIDVVPLAKGYRNENEVLVQGIDAPTETEEGGRLPIKVRIRSYNPNPVRGTLTVQQVADGKAMSVADTPVEVRLQPGLNVLRFDQPLNREQRSFTYEAIFHPKGVEIDGKLQAGGLPGDRVQNNRASTHVIAHGQRRILVVESTPGEHDLLVARLRAAGGGKFQVETARAGALPEDAEAVAVKLADYDCVLLANVPSDLLSKEQQEVFRTNTHDQGCGLVMIGGPDGFGAGGWQETPVEKALPVDCEVKAMKVEGKGGLALIMHASEMAEGNYWQKEIAKLAIKKLSPVDMVGVIYFDWGRHVWHVPFQEVGGSEHQRVLLRLVDKMSPGDMPDCNPALSMAHDELLKPEHNLVKRHIIFISDGDHWTADPKLLAQLKSNQVTCTTVCVTSHGMAEVQKMQAVALATGGRFYNVTSPKALPAIYTQETRLISQSFVVRKRFKPDHLFQRGPTEGLPRDLEPLYGYVRTTPKESPLVEMSIETTSGGQHFPILAYWHYGLGKAVAFTSDARSGTGIIGWDRDWAESPLYAKFWEQVIDYAARARESGRLALRSEYRDGTIKFILEARQAGRGGKPQSGLALRGAVTPPSPVANENKQVRLRFVEKSAGTYEAEVKAEDAGSYFANVQVVKPVEQMVNGRKVRVDNVVDSVRGGVTIPYSPEFADVESSAGLETKGPALLEKLRAATGGKAFEDDDQALAQAAALPSEVFRAGLRATPSRQTIWPWLLLAAAVCLLLDVAVRRIALDPMVGVMAARRLWERLRGREVVVGRAPEYFDRLRSRKAEIGEALSRARARQRFDVPAAPAPPVTTADQGTAAPAPRPPTPPAPRVGPEAPQQEPADYASRLLKAKKKVWEEREKDK
jgi:uncharacterized membrane protein